MNNLHEAPLLHLLLRRYRDDEIYTFTGDVLISINPYKTLPHLYEVDLDELVSDFMIFNSITVLVVLW